MGEPEDGGHEDVEEVLLLLDGVVQERVLEPEAGVVDQQADRPGGVGHPGLDRRELLAVAEVGHDHLDRDAVLRGQVGGQPLQPLAGAGHDDQVVALGGEPVGEGPADARGGAGDEDGRAVLGRGGGLRHAAQHSWTDVETATTLRHDGKVPASKTKILAVANQKGGVAKTTTVASLGAALAELGNRVLLVDLDPQACLTFSLGIDPEDLELSIHHVLTKGLDATEVVIATEDGVDLLPATIELARAEADLLTRTGREHVVKMALEDLDYDWVLLDCPPSLGVLTVAALTAARGVLIPLQCETLSHRGVGQLLDTVHDVRRFTNRKLEVWGCCRRCTTAAPTTPARCWTTSPRPTSSTSSSRRSRSRSGSPRRRPRAGRS